MKTKITKVGKLYLNEDKDNIWYSKYKSKNITHRLDGPAIFCKIKCSKSFNCKTCKINPIKCVRNIEFWIDDFQLIEIDFAKETNHSICKKCKKFCNQQCFF